MSEQQPIDLYAEDSAEQSQRDGIFTPFGLVITAGAILMVSVVACPF